MALRHLVTGAGGLIGFELTRQLVNAGDHVTALDSGMKSGLEDLERLARERPEQLTLIRGDLAKDRTLLRGGFDAVFHLAAIVGVQYVSDHPWETLSVNLYSTLHALDHALAQGCKAFVFASSSENYAVGVDRGYVPVPTPESAILSIDDISLPRWSYAASKIAGESAVFSAARAGGFAPVVVRFHNVYGPRMGLTHVIPELIDRARRRVDPFPVYGTDQTRSFLHVEDAARALRTILDAALAGQHGIFNIGCAVETRIDDLAREVLAIAGFAPQLDARPAPPGSVKRRLPDVRRLDALGFAPRWSLRAGLEDCWRARQG